MRSQLEELAFCCATSPPRSKAPATGCRRSRIGSRSSSASSSATARRWTRCWLAAPAIDSGARRARRERRAAGGASRRRSRAGAATTPRPRPAVRGAPERRRSLHDAAGRKPRRAGDARNPLRAPVRRRAKATRPGGARPGSIASSCWLSPNPGEDLRPLARIASGGELSRVMLAIKTLASTDVPGKTLIFDEVDAGIGGRVATWSASGCGRWRRTARCSASPTCRRSRPAATRTIWSSKQVVGERTVTGVEPLTGRRTRRGDRPHDGRSRNDGEGPRRGERSARIAQANQPQAKGERRKRKCGVESSENPKRKGTYFVETFGCQMNVHDSERMAGLLEADGYAPAAAPRDADVVVINTCSVREKAEEKLFTRLGEIRVESRGDRPPTGRRRRRLRRAAGRRATSSSARSSSTSSSGRRR